MQALIDSVKKALEQENWYAALTLALTLPDICGKVEHPKVGTGKRYSDWFNQYVGFSYQSMLGHPKTKHVFLSGNDCYALRCAFLHEGSSNITQQRAREALDDFIFRAPRLTGSMHICQSSQKLILEVDKFCKDITDGVEHWLTEIKHDKGKQVKLNQILTIIEIKSA